MARLDELSGADLGASVVASMIGTARHIPIEAVREAAAALSAMRGGAVRTPLVQVDLPAGPRTPRRFSSCT